MFSGIILPSNKGVKRTMQIAFRKKDGQAELVRMWSIQEKMVVPAWIDGCPVTKIGPYAFSAHKEGIEKDVLIWEVPEGLMESETAGSVIGEEQWKDTNREPLRCGTNIGEIHLPETVQVIGNYAFYGCINMKVFHGTDRITRMGSGVFTGCRLSRVEIDFYDGEKSCLKEILTDIRYGITAILTNCRETKRAVAKVVFPEFYADAVENTPARIVETHYYGSGGDYRECFYRRELDFQKYDSMFVLSAARDQSEVTAEVALARLMYPLRLAEQARLSYEHYVRENVDKIAELCLEHLENHTALSVADPVDVLRFCCENKYFSRTTLETAILKASEKRQTEVLSILMDERQKHFPRKKKTFDL